MAASKAGDLIQQLAHPIHALQGHKTGTQLDSCCNSIMDEDKV